LLLAIELLLLTAFLVLGVRYGPFANFDSPAALVTAFVAIAAMAVQNDMQRVHLPDLPATTFMTGNATNATIGAIGMLTGDKPAQTKSFRANTGRMALNLVAFAGGCAVSALLYWTFGFWCLAAPIILVLAAAALIRAGDGRKEVK